MPVTIYLRIIGYVTTVALHIMNIIMMTNSFQGEAMKEPEVRHFQKMQPFFFTCWTFTFQIIFAILSLYCDVKILSNAKNKEYRLPKILKKLRDEMFNTVVWPATTLVFTMFWLLYTIDRELVYPKTIDKAISNTSNHIMHTYILFFVIWEILLYYRKKKEDKIWRNIIPILIEIAYFITLYGVKWYYGVWIYPIFGKTEQYLRMLIFFMTIAGFLYFIQKLQWILYSMFWTERRKLNAKIN